MDEATFSSDEEVLEVDGVNFNELAMVAHTQNTHAVETVESGGDGDGDTQQRSGAGAAVLVLDDDFAVVPLQSADVDDTAVSNHHPQALELDGDVVLEAAVLGGGVGVVAPGEDAVVVVEMQSSNGTRAVAPVGGGSVRVRPTLALPVRTAAAEAALRACSRTFRQR